MNALILRLMIFVHRSTVIITLAIALATCAQLRASDSPKISNISRLDPTASISSRQADEDSLVWDPWFELLELSPYPYTAELPPHSATMLDGTYVRVDPRPGERAGCRRCPPYPPEGGIWRLKLESGIFRVFHKRTTWRSLGSFTLDGQRITFFNDPHCIEAYGTYVWNLEAGALRFQVIEDSCGTHLRAQNIANQRWESCQPPNIEAAVSEHWTKPIGCDLESSLYQSK